MRRYDVPETIEGKSDMLTTVGNSVTDRFGWSSPIEEVTSTSGINTSGSSGREITREETIPQLQSYRSLVESYNLVSGGYSKTPDLKDFIQQFESNLLTDPPGMGTQVDNEQVICHGLFKTKFYCYIHVCVCARAHTRVLE